ncbi:hypothetical protein LINPERPRIM_LOCUS32120 [Linum perenne]
MVVDEKPGSPVQPRPSFRDNVTGFWSKGSEPVDLCYSDESDADDADEDPKCPTIRIPGEEKIRVRSRFQHAIIVSTLDRCFPFAFMSRKLPQLWAKKGVVRVSGVGFGFYVVNFETISDYDRAMFGGPWMVNDHYVVIQEWRPYFQPEETSLSTLRVWVRLSGIPFEYFDSAILKLIGDRIGKTVRIDHTTLEGSRGNFARICVEVDLSKPLLSKYRLRRQIRRIEYEGLHVICFNCDCYGHKDEACKHNPEADVTENQTTSFVNPVFQSAAEQDDHPEIDENFGPWMQVKRNRRKQKIVEAPPAGASAPRLEGRDAKKGNRFGIFTEKESSDVEPQIPPQSKTLPLEFDVNEPLIEDLQEEEKENLDPESCDPQLFPMHTSFTR